MLVVTGSFPAVTQTFPPEKSTPRAGNMRSTYSPSGLPCIVGRSGGAPEAIVDAETGVLVSGTDPEELATVIRGMVGSIEQRRKMGCCGRSRALKQFTWDASARKIAELHQRLASHE
jgi:glycosyltransferase involved in cell wall biosynthesis